MIDLPDDLSINPTAASIERLIGPDLLARLSMDIGSGQVFIPKKPGEHSPLAVSIGLDAAMKISSIYGGMYLEIPIRAGRRARILKLHSEGFGPTAIARKLNCHRRHVHDVLADEQDKRQADLFA